MHTACEDARLSADFERTRLVIGTRRPRYIFVAAAVLDLLSFSQVPIFLAVAVAAIAAISF